MPNVIMSLTGNLTCYNGITSNIALLTLFDMNLQNKIWFPDNTKQGAVLTMESKNVAISTYKKHIILNDEEV